MNEKLDLTKILKDCPSGVEFYSPMCGKITFNRINEKSTRRPIETDMYIFTTDGKYNLNGECMLFPSKDQRDWSKWHIPFVDGDIFVCSNLCGNHIAIYNNLKRSNFYGYYAIVTNDGEFNIDGICSGNAYRLATEEEKQKLFKALEDNGYKWNAEKKKLEKLIVPKFKVGDKVRNKANGRMTGTIIALYEEVYEVKNPLGNEFPLDFGNQDNWELTPNKFDPKTLQTFDKVLARHRNDNTWYADFISHYNEVGGYAVCAGGVRYSYYIPYNEDTKHLAGKSDEAPESYRYCEE